ncbi:FAD binding domain-containing protein [Aminipila terrae]|uniref:Molybdopterin dehydrogenase n=1 Tax=Aminipila terrae TaxID=2697030 RepID=A0A6P1MH72_9FIRM|nr:FAD binding domain-containing protein [Aminipila terrae]QHI72533.1 molybdopterin dehydrogenase [Aminipila terrae]
MFNGKNYLRPSTLEEAWTLNQNKNNKIIGGMLWLKMGHKNISTMIDLSDLGLSTIEENDQEFRIGAMCTLRELEEHSGMEQFFSGMIRNSIESIVGVQFRNLATVGGSVYSRFGFSDILTVFMALDSYVELYKGGIIPLEKYADMPYDQDILMRVIIKKRTRKGVYLSIRQTATDFPVLACAVSQNQEGAWKIIYGARPGKALAFESGLPEKPGLSDIEEAIGKLKSWGHFAGNMRGSAEYRKALAEALLRKAIRYTMDMTRA